MKQVIVMRKDLNMRKGKMCAQAAHASLGVLLKDMREHPFRWIWMVWYHSVFNKWPNTNDFGKWLNGPFVKITVSVEDEESLLWTEIAADSNGLPNVLITDAGRTEFNGIPTKTCMAIGPAEDSEIDRITGKLKLL